MTYYWDPYLGVTNAQVTVMAKAQELVQAQELVAHVQAQELKLRIVTLETVQVSFNLTLHIQISQTQRK